MNDDISPVESEAPDASSAPVDSSPVESSAPSQHQPAAQTQQQPMSPWDAFKRLPDFQGQDDRAIAARLYQAMEREKAAAHKLESRLRRGKDRQKVHYGDKTPVSVREATAVAPDLETAFDPAGSVAGAEAAASVPAEDHEPGRIVRVKEHPAQPMAVDDALYEMELVGHDFFLFHDSETDRPTVVYRRHAYDYGLIRLA